MAVNTNGLTGYAKLWSDNYNQYGDINKANDYANQQFYGNQNSPSQAPKMNQAANNTMNQPSSDPLFEMFGQAMGWAGGSGLNVDTSSLMNRAIDIGNQAYNKQKSLFDQQVSRLNSQRDSALNRINTNLSNAKSDLENDMFQKYLASRQQMANSGLSGTGLANDADVRLGLNRDQAMERIQRQIDDQRFGVESDYRNSLGAAEDQLSQFDAQDVIDRSYQSMYDSALKASQSQADARNKVLSMFLPLMFTDANTNARLQSDMVQTMLPYQYQTADQRAKLGWDQYQFGNVSATDQAKMMQDMYQWGNISPYQQAQLATTARGQDLDYSVGMANNQLGWANNSLGWANNGISQQRLEMDIEKAVQTSGNKQLETQLKGFQTQYDSANKNIDRLVRTKQIMVQSGMDTSSIDQQIATEMANMKNAEQSIVRATTPYVQADLSQDNWYRNSGFNRKQGGGENLQYKGDWKKATPQTFKNYKRLGGGDARKNPQGYNLATNAISQALSEKGMPNEWLMPLLELTARESSWNPNAQNKSSTAYGLFQFLNDTWKNYGHTKTSDPYKQALAGVDYVKKRYGDPWKALAFHDVNNWY